jgi:hypothetical protein
MAEASHADIIERVRAVELGQAQMASDIAVVKADSKRFALGIENNRVHFESQLLRLSEKQSDTHIMLEKHRSEVQSGVKVIIGVMTFGLTALGILVAVQ